MGKALITGGAGFIGSHLADGLVARGAEVTLLDDLSTGRRENVSHLIDSGDAQLVEGSVLDLALVNELMAEADICFHLAAAVGVELVVDRPLESLLRNVRGVDIVTEASCTHETRLVFTSTSEIYGKLSDGALAEDSDRLVGTPAKSRWAYSTAKVFGEMLAYGYHRERDAETVVVRLFNTVGPRQTGAYGMVVPRLVGQAIAGEDLTVYGDGDQSRCFTHVGDVVEAILGVGNEDAALGGVFNIGRDDEVTILDLANLIIERTESPSQVRLVPYEEAYGDGFEELGKRRPDTTGLTTLTGWSPTRGLEEIIDDVVEYQRSDPGRVGAELDVDVH